MGGGVGAEFRRRERLMSWSIACLFSPSGMEKSAQPLKRRWWISFSCHWSSLAGLSCAAVSGASPSAMLVVDLVLRRSLRMVERVEASYSQESNSTVPSKPGSHSPSRGSLRTEVEVPSGK